MAELAPQKKTPDSFTVLMIRLFKGVLYREDAARDWQTLMEKQPAVRDYVSKVGLALEVNEAEGHAFLKSLPEPEDEDEKLPRLISRRQLSFPVSLILALLRRRLAEFDAGGSDTRLILAQEEIVDLVRLFLADSNNEVKLTDQIETHLKRIEEMGFIRTLKQARNSKDEGRTNQYEVQRILKSFVDAQWLSEFDDKLKAYAEHIGITHQKGLYDEPK